MINLSSAEYAYRVVKVKALNADFTHFNKSTVSSLPL